MIAKCKVHGTTGRREAVTALAITETDDEPKGRHENNWLTIHVFSPGALSWSAMGVRLEDQFFNAQVPIT